MNTDAAESKVAATNERIAALAAQVRAGDLRIGARLMRDLDDRIPLAQRVMQELWPSTGHAFVIGVTGNPGAGKSTVVDGLIGHYRQAGKRVGVVAIDPSSPFSGGAILGDRIRMQRHALDDGVFIRSLASRGHLGGLSRSTGEVVAVLDALGFDPVIIETVGVGQGEVDVVAQADTKVVVTVPGLGDEVQALKAGILEIADVLVVNKADREGAERTVRDLLTMLDLRHREGHRDGGSSSARVHSAVRRAEPDPDKPGGDVEIVRTVATRGEGIEALATAIDRHRSRAEAGAQDRRARRALRELRDAAVDRFEQRLSVALSTQPGLLEAVQKRALDPYRAADQILAALMKG